MDNSFRNLVESLNRIDESAKQGKAPEAQVKGKEKAKKTPDSEHPFKGRLVGEEAEDYGFLNDYISEDELEEDLVSQIKAEMADVIKAKDKDGKPKKFNRGIRGRKGPDIHSKAGEKKLHSPEDPLFDEAEVDEGSFSKAAKNARHNAAAKKDAHDRMMEPVTNKEKMFPKKGGEVRKPGRKDSYLGKTPGTDEWEETGRKRRETDLDEARDPSDHSKNPYHKVLTKHGYEHVGSAIKDQGLAKHSPYTQHNYVHSSGDDHKVYVWSYHDGTKPVYHTRNKQKSNNIIAPGHGSTKPGLDRLLTDVHGTMDEARMSASAKRKAGGPTDREFEKMHGYPEKDDYADEKDDVEEGYYTMPPMDTERYTERKGLEGPFRTHSGKVVYYDPKEGKYYDPDSDFYLSHEEYDALNTRTPTHSHGVEEGIKDTIKRATGWDETDDEKRERNATDAGYRKHRARKNSKITTRKVKPEELFREDENGYSFYIGVPGKSEKYEITGINSSKGRTSDGIVATFEIEFDKGGHGSDGITYFPGYSKIELTDSQGNDVSIEKVFDAFN